MCRSPCFAESSVPCCARARLARPAWRASATPPLAVVTGSAWERGGRARRQNGGGAVLLCSPAAKKRPLSARGGSANTKQKRAEVRYARGALRSGRPPPAAPARGGLCCTPPPIRAGAAACRLQPFYRAEQGRAEQSRGEQSRAEATHQLLPPARRQNGDAVGPSSCAHAEASQSPRRRSAVRTATASAGCLAGSQSRSRAEADAIPASQPRPPSERRCEVGSLGFAYRSSGIRIHPKIRHTVRTASRIFRLYSNAENTF